MHDGSFPIRCDDETLDPSSALLKISKMVVEASTRLGRAIDLAPHYKEMLEQAGFVDVEIIHYKWPTNAWPKAKKMKTIGTWSLANVDGGWDGMWLVLFAHGLGLSKEEITALCAEGRRELRDPRIHAYWPV